jgi:SAM-dependent methyltransferase
MTGQLRERNMDSHIEFNRRAWDAISTSAEGWFRPVSATEIEQARTGNWSIRVTAKRDVPRRWLEPITGRRVLCLGGGGGHQAPILAAAGAQVTVLDISDNQLAIDGELARQHALDLTTVRGDMRRVPFADESFDLIVNPCAVNFSPEVQPVWGEAFRVLRAGGVLVAGFLQPLNYLFDPARLEKGDFAIAPAWLSGDIKSRGFQVAPELPVEFAHSLEELVGGQIAAGFVIDGFLEDRWGGRDAMSRHIGVFAATRAVKPAGLPATP